MLNKNALTIRLLFEDSIGRYSVYEDCTLNELADCVRQLALLKEAGWIINVSDLDTISKEPEATRIIIKSKTKNNHFWCKHKIIFVRKEYTV